MRKARLHKYVDPITSRRSWCREMVNDLRTIRSQVIEARMWPFGGYPLSGYKTAWEVWVRLADENHRTKDDPRVLQCQPILDFRLAWTRYRDAMRGQRK